MYSSITNISATANHLRILFMGVLAISFLVRTIMFKMFAIVPNMQIYVMGGENNKNQY